MVLSLLGLHFSYKSRSRSPSRHFKTRITIRFRYCETAGTISYLTDNSTNWNNAFTERAQWDAGALNLVAATGRSSLGLSNVDNTTDVPKPVSASTGAANTAATLNAAKFCR
jgi:hypothetical protein